MRTSLNDIKLAEAYLQGQMDPAGKLVYDARLINNRTMRIDLKVLGKIFQLLRLYRHEMIRSDLSRIHDNFFSDPEKTDFRTSVLQHFKP